MARLINSLVDLNDEMDARLWIEELRSVVNEFAIYNYSGTGSPEAVVVAPLGSIYHNKSGGANTSLYVKETEVSTPDNVGWVAK